MEAMERLGQTEALSLQLCFKHVLRSSNHKAIFDAGIKDRLGFSHFGWQTSDNVGHTACEPTHAERGEFNRGIFGESEANTSHDETALLSSMFVDAPSNHLVECIFCGNGARGLFFPIPILPSLQFISSKNRSLQRHGTPPCSARGRS
jgi:hypothetical protein